MVKMKEKIENMVKETLVELNNESGNPKLENVTEETRLYGSNSALDSLGLVNLITDLEDKIADQFDQDVILADEKAMSQKTSPFRTIKSLTDYIQKILA
jgi:acyl carrier protein